MCSLSTARYQFKFRRQHCIILQYILSCEIYKNEIRRRVRKEISKINLKTNLQAKNERT